MRNRLLMGAFRYGLLQKKRERVGQWDMVGGMRRLLDKYEATGNLEALVDMANYCLLEFVMWRAQGHEVIAEDDGEHCQLKA